MAGGDDEVGELRRAAHVGHAIGRAGAKAAPRLDALEVVGTERREILRDRLDDALHADGVDVLVQARDLHRPAETQRVAHRRHGHAGLGEDGAELRQLARLGQRQAVAFAGLHGDAEPQFLSDRRRPGTSRQDELVRLERVLRGDYGEDARPVARGADDLGIPQELHPHRIALPFQSRHEAVRRQVAVLRKIDRARDVHRHRRIEPRRLLGVQHLGGHAEIPGLLGHRAFIVEGVLFLAEHQQALLHEAEVVRRKRGQLLIGRAAGEAEIADERRAPLDMRPGRGLPELEAPAQQVEVEARLDVEGRFRVPHPLQAERHHAGRGQRDEVARHDHARVAEGAAVALFRVAVDDGDAVALAGGVVGRAQADDAAADDDDVLGAGHGVERTPPD